MKKKTIILIITVALICAFVIAIRAISDKNENGENCEYSEEETTTYSEPIKVPEVTTHKSILSPEEYVPIKLEDAMKIKKGMSRYEVHDLIGLPEVADTFSGIAYPFAPKWGIEDGSSLFIYFYFDGVVENAPSKYISNDYIEMIVRFNAEREKSGCDLKGFYDGLSEEDKAVWDGCVPKAYSAIIRDKDGTTVLAELFSVKENDGADDSLLEQIKDRMTYDEVTESMTH